MLCVKHLLIILKSSVITMI